MLFFMFLQENLWVFPGTSTIKKEQVKRGRVAQYRGGPIEMAARQAQLMVLGTSRESNNLGRVVQTGLIGTELNGINQNPCSSHLSKALISGF
jgi:hypothetical protein